MPPALPNSVRPRSIDFHRGEAGLQELKVARQGRSDCCFSCAAAKEFGGKPNYRLLGKMSHRGLFVRTGEKIQGRNQAKDQIVKVPRQLGSWAIMAAFFCDAHFGISGPSCAPTQAWGTYSLLQATTPLCDRVIRSLLCKSALSFHPVTSW